MLEGLIEQAHRTISNLPISRKLNLSSLVILATTVFTVALISNGVSASMIVGKTMRSSERNLEMVSANLDQLFSHVEDLSKVAIVNDSIQGMLRTQMRSPAVTRFEQEFASRSFLDTVIEPRNLISSMILYGKTEVLAASSHIGLSEAAKQRILANGAVAKLEGSPDQMTWIGFRKVDYEIEGKSLCVALVRPIFNIADYSRIGVLEANIPEAAIRATYSRLGGGTTGRIFVMDPSGKVVSSSRGSDIGSSMAGTFWGSLIDPEPRTARIIRIDGERMLIASARYPRFSWILVSSVPLNELLADTHSVTVLIFLSGLVCVILALILSFFISRSITRPIARLTRLMAAAGQGDLEVRADATGKDEVAVLAGSFNAMVQEISVLLERVDRERRMKQEYELAALQAQINPHFLYNTLESVCSLAQLGRNDDVFRMVKSLAHFYRTALGSGRSIISVREELELVRHYLEIQKIRYADKLEFSFDVEERVLDASIIKLSVQPIVENAIYHGIKGRSGGGSVHIRACCKGSDIVITVSDDGVGFDAASRTRYLGSSAPAFEDNPETGLAEHQDSSNQKSFGLPSIDARIRLYFGNAYGISLESGIDTGTSVDIRIPSGGDQ